MGLDFVSGMTDLRIPPIRSGITITNEGIFYPVESDEPEARPSESRDAQSPDGEPIWKCDRMAGSRTELPDGRIVCVGGAYDDWYDPDFCIDNDVVVLGPAGDVEIYGYPREVFPPTDRHTATLVAGRLVLIGSLGYPEDQREGITPVYTLDLSTYRIDPVATTGESPGWISLHDASLPSDGTIRVKGGYVLASRGPRRYLIPNYDEFVLDPATSAWTRLTDRKWRQFLIRREGWGDFDSMPPNRVLYPSAADYKKIDSGDWREAQFLVGGVGIRVYWNCSTIQMQIQSALPADLAERVAGEILANVEASIGEACVLVDLS